MHLDGHWVVIGIIPANTKLWHMRNDDTIPKLEWFAFDFAMSYAIVIPGPGNGGDLDKPLWVLQYVTIFPPPTHTIRRSSQ